MKRLAILTAIVIMCHASFAQQDTASKYIVKGVYRTIGAKNAQEAHLVDVNDTALVVAPDLARFRRDFMNTSSIPYQQLNVIEVRRRGNIGRGALYGGVIGGVSMGGLVAGLAAHTCSGCQDNGSKGLAIVAATLTGGFFGALIGGIVGGSTEKRFVIGGDKKKFDKMRLTVLEMAYGNRFKR